MKTVPVRDMTGARVGEEQFDDASVGQPVRQDILHAAVVAYLANQRQGTAAAKTRAEVSGSGRKPWRQKGTGRARAGEIRSPVWRHGGVVFAPKPRDYRVALPKRVRQAALREAVRDRLMRDRVTILAIGAMERPKTRAFASFLKASDIEGSALFVLGADPATRTVEMSIRNLRNARSVRAEQLHAYGVLAHDHLVVVQAALPAIRRILASEPPAQRAEETGQ